MAGMFKNVFGAQSSGVANPDDGMFILRNCLSAALTIVL